MTSPPKRRSPGDRQNSRGSKSKVITLPQRKVTTPPQDSSVASQRARILHALRTVPGGITTVYMRRVLDVMENHARLHELRHQYGHNIVSVWTVDTTEAGHQHRVCRYYLMAGKWQGKAS